MANAEAVFFFKVGVVASFVLAALFLVVR